MECRDRTEAMWQAREQPEGGRRGEKASGGGLRVVYLMHRVGN